jgi:hypothetical protein
MRAGRRVLAILVAAALVSVAAPAWILAAQAESRDCASAGSGELVCWDGSAPVRVRVSGRVIQLAASGRSTCALTEPGEVYCWGPAAPAPGSGGDPLLLVTIGSLLVAGGATLLMMARR